MPHFTSFLPSFPPSLFLSVFLCNRLGLISRRLRHSEQGSGFGAGRRKGEGRESKSEMLCSSTSYLTGHSAFWMKPPTIRRDHHPQGLDLHLDEKWNLNSRRRPAFSRGQETSTTRSWKSYFLGLQLPEKHRAKKPNGRGP